MSKNDYVDAFAIADFARVGKITSSLGAAANSWLYNALQDIVCIC